MESWTSLFLLLIACENTAKLTNLAIDTVSPIHYIIPYNSKIDYLECQDKRYYKSVVCIFLILFFLNQWILSVLVTHEFKIEDRRRKVATLLAQSMTDSEIV